MYSSTNDLLVLGSAILKSTLLSPAQTRRWMKPVTHTSSITASVGAPWEIFRVPTKRGVIDLYTKRGDVGVYAGIIVLCPVYDIGFTILSAAARESIADASVTVLADIITQTLLPAVEAAAKDNAASTFAGTYKATNGINSSITFIVDDGPGLRVQQWVSNGTDVLEKYLVLNQATGDGLTTSVRLYPTNLQSFNSQRGFVDKMAFRAVFEVFPKNVDTGAFSQNCATWDVVDDIMYGSIAIDEFLFQFNQAGDAISVEPRIFRITLLKET
jgi:hypothetical protein